MGKAPENLYLFGKVKALENDLFDSGRFIRLTEHDNPDDFFNDISDSKYYEHIINKNFEEGLTEYLNKWYLYFRDKMVNKNALNIFFIKNDILNFNNHLKGIENKELYQPSVYGLNWREKEKMPGLLRKVSNRLKKYQISKDNRVINEGLIEKISIDMINEDMIPTIGSKLILTYWKFYIDQKNFLKNSESGRLGIYFSGGNISEKFWLNDNIMEKFSHKIEAQSYIKGLKDQEKTDWEYSLRIWMGKLLKEMRKITFGPEPIVSFLISLEEEIKNLITIYTGIKLNIPAEIIKTKINNAYV